MVLHKMTVRIADGFHMRSAMVLADAMNVYHSDVMVCHAGSVVDAKSILELMAACIRYGDEIEIMASGPDERAALAAAVQVVDVPAPCCLA